MEISKYKMFWLKYKYWLYLLYLPVYLIAFFLIEGYIDNSYNYWVSYAPLDSIIPFIDWFVIFYDLWYPFMLVVGVYLLFKERQAYERMAYMLIFGFSFSLLFFLILPNGQNLRLESFEKETIFTQIIASLWETDTHTNVLPSMHVYGSIFTVFAVLDSKTIKNIFVRIGAVILGLLICASTCIIKQHSILDVYAGLILFAILYWIIYHNKIFNNYDGAVEYISELKGDYVMFKQFV